MNVLVGTVRSLEQLEACLTHHFYYVPVSVKAEEHFPIHEVAIYQSKNLFGRSAGIEWYGEVASIEKVKRREIVELYRDSDDLYYRLNVVEWKKLDRRIEAKEYGVPIIAYTNDFLLKHSTSVPELFLKTEEEYRFLTELKRVFGDAAMINDSDVHGFVFGEYRVIFEEGEIKLFGQAGMIDHCEINDFIHCPNAKFRGLMRSMSV